MPQKKDIPRVKLDDAVLRTHSTNKTQIGKSPAPQVNTLQEAQDKDQSSPYEEWSKQDLYERATEVGIEGSARRSRKDLINILRDY